MNNLLNIVEQYKDILKADSWALIYKNDQIILDKLEKIKGDLKAIVFFDIKEARIFNENDELKLWKYNGKLKYRLFSETDQTAYEEPYEETMLLQGCFKEQGQKITVKNYYKYNENGLIQFQDARITEVI